MIVSYVHFNKTTIKVNIPVAMCWDFSFLLRADLVTDNTPFNYIHQQFLETVRRERREVMTFSEGHHVV